MIHREFPDTVIITVTQEDLDDGRPFSSFCCAGALAGNRAFPGYYTQFGPNSFGVRTGRNEELEELATYQLDSTGRQFIKDFDTSCGSPYSGSPVPLTFTATKVQKSR
jgi:hypothetical protein